MTKIGRISSAILFFGWLWTEAALARVSVEAHVDREEVSMNSTVNLTVVVTSDESIEPQEPRLKLSNFDLLNQWQSSATSQKLVSTPSGMQFETQRRKEFTYALSPLKEGLQVIESLEVIVNGKVYRTDPIKVAVGAAGSGRGGNAAKGKPKGRPSFPNPGDEEADDDDIFNQMLQQRQQMLQQMQNAMGARGGGGGFFDDPQEEPAAMGMANAAFRSVPKNPDEAFFIGVEVDKTEVFEGEQVTVNWYLYTRGQMETLDRLKFPDLRGFWKEIIEEVPSIQFHSETVGGASYRKALLASHALFPIKPGTSTIDEYKIKSRVRMPSQVFGSYGQAYEYTKSSVRVPITVKPLPTEGRPSDFTGGVGKFEVNAKADEKIMAHQPFSLHIRFEGSGNAKLIELPPIAYPEGVEVYDTKAETKFFKNGKSYKDFEVLLIPRKEGDMTIPAIGMSFFDPSAKKYYTKKSEPINIHVNPGNPQNPSGGGLATALTKPKEETRNPLTVTPTWNSGSWGGVLNSQMPGALGSMALFIFFGIKTIAGLRGGQKGRNLSALIKTRSQEIQKLIDGDQHRLAGVKVISAFGLALGLAAEEQGQSSLPVDKLIEKIPPSLRRETEASLRKNFEYFQALGFAPEELVPQLVSNGRAKTQWEETKKILLQIANSQQGENE